MFLGAKLHLCELIGPHRTCTDVSDFAGPDKVVEGFHGFFDGNILVKTVDLEEVDIGGIETFERRFDVGEDGIAGKTWGSGKLETG